MEILAGFLLGFLGSPHCAGMCGPIVFALPGKTDKSIPFILKRVFYNLGRVVTYSLMGLFFGLIGSKFVLSGLQQAVSITAGILLLLFFVLPYKVKSRLLLNPIVNKPLNFIKFLLSRLLHNTSFTGFFLIGLMNGFLPCGFVYVGLAGALVLSDPIKSMFFMTLFGLGTIPVLFGTSFAVKLISIGLRNKLKKLIPTFSILLAIIFILRGLNLGIPYLSPKLKNMTETIHQSTNCH